MQKEQIHFKQRTYCSLLKSSINVLRGKKGDVNMTIEEAIKSVHHAEESIYKAQANDNMEERQRALQQLFVAQEKVEQAYKMSLNSDDQHRIHQAQEQLRHLLEAHQALEN